MNDYAKFHQNPVNLMIHIVAVPLFVLSVIGLFYLIVDFGLLSLAAGIVGLVVSLILQGIGHAREPVPAEPFAGPSDFLNRIITEQFYKFPKFVVSGRWWANLRQ